MPTQLSVVKRENKKKKRVIMKRKRRFLPDALLQSAYSDRHEGWGGRGATSGRPKHSDSVACSTIFVKGSSGP
jgi:hypothetical protein